MKLSEWRSIVVTILLLLAEPVAMHAQDPEQISAAHLIADFQQGTINFNFIGPVLRQVILSQTGGTGRYFALGTIGPITRLTLLGRSVLPNGVLRMWRVDFPQISLVWEIGQDNAGVVQVVSFRQVPAGWTPGGPSSPLPTPQAQPQTGQTPAPSGGQEAKPLPTSEEDGCREFPNLC